VQSLGQIMCKDSKLLPLLKEVCSASCELYQAFFRPERFSELTTSSSFYLVQIPAVTLRNLNTSAFSCSVRDSLKGFNLRDSYISIDAIHNLRWKLITAVMYSPFCRICHFDSESLRSMCLTA